MRYLYNIKFVMLQVGKITVMTNRCLYNDVKV